MMGSVRSARDIEAALVKKGFQRVDGGDHIRFYFYGANNDAPIARTKISHGKDGNTVSAKLMGEMARQLRLTKSQFLALIDCTLSEEDYREVLEKRGLAV